MLQSVPPTYRPSFEILLEALKQGNNSSKKLYYNFKTESRVSKSTGRAFGKSVKAQIDQGIKDPRTIIDDALTSSNLVLRGRLPKPKNKLPKRYARIDDANAIADYGCIKDKLEGSDQDLAEKLIKYIDEEDKDALRECLEPFIDHEQKRFVWIGDAKEIEPLYQTMNHDNLRNRLGLALKKKGARLLLMTFPPENIHSDRKDTAPRIPTVIEAGCFEAYTPAPSEETLSGWAIHLKTGKPTHREWVCRKISTLGDFNFVRLPGNERIENRTLKKDPPDTFLELYARLVDEGKV